jgi:hypothetical protein
MKKIYTIGLALAALLFANISLHAQNTLSQARVYVNPGHGGWGSNDRPMATINYAVLDTLGFFETNTNLLKGLALRDELEKAGVGYVRMSRTINGITPTGTTAYNYEVPEGNGQIVTLSVICQDVEENNMDYFISIHSNATAEGSATNYPLLLYRGTDDAPGNGLINAKAMAIDAWKYVVKNDITYHSAYTSSTSNNSRGDISFYGSSSTSLLGYTGYLGVLKHSCDGYLSEGCFHTYQPERQRLLNNDYCKQEGLRYSRAVRAWFGDNTETKGSIMGTVKDKYKALEGAEAKGLYNYKSGSPDQYYPLNNVTVALQKADGTPVGAYTTDKEYNGVYVFNNLTPGDYQLVYDIAGYWKETEDIEVVANETSFINKYLSDLSQPDPNLIVEEAVDEVLYYPHPVQDGDIAGASSYNFTKDGEVVSIAALNGLTIRRALLRSGKYYVLAVDAAKNPKLLVIDPATGDLIKEMSTSGLITAGYNGKSYPYILSDIAFTNDGVLVGANSTVVGKENNTYQTGDFYLYKWQASEGVALENATPAVVLTLPTNTSNSLYNSGNNNSNFMANSIALNGNIDDFTFYFDSHAGSGWTTTYGIRYVTWTVKNGVVISAQYNDTDWNESQLGEDVRMTLSPLNIDHIVIDGNGIKPREFKIDNSSTTLGAVSELNVNMPVASTGATYFRYAKRIYMSAPVVEKQADNTYSYKSQLLDITDGFTKAKSIGETEAYITDEPAITYMTSTGVVDNADIDQYLLAGTKAVKYTTKGVIQPSSPARVFAYGLTAEYSAADQGYKIKFSLNEDADAVSLILQNTNNTVEIDLGAKSKGANEFLLANTSIPANESFNWSIRASAANVARFVQLSNDDAAYKFSAPKGIAIDKSPESPYFGRVYVTNTTAGTVAGRNTTAGIYVLGPDASDITNQGDAAYTGNIAWTGVNGEGPRKIAIADDGRLFIAAASAANAGIYYMNPETFVASPFFPASSSTAIQVTAVGVRGSGDATQLYAVDKTTSGYTWKKMVNVYNIGANTTWSGAPNYSAAASSYIGNDNNSIVPVAGGYWAGQYRGGGASNSVANPCMFYFSDARQDAVFNSTEYATPLDLSSQNGGLAVNEEEKTGALSYNGGLYVFEYKMNKEGIPTVTPKFTNSLGVEAVTYDDFAFDYAGNLYALSNSGKFVSVWAMPTDKNEHTTPANKNSLLTRGDNNAIPAVKAIFKVYPNPASSYITIESAEPIKSIQIYDLTGKLVKSLSNTPADLKTVDVSSLKSGVYLLKINKNSVVKFVRR